MKMGMMTVTLQYVEHTEIVITYRNLDGYVMKVPRRKFGEIPAEIECEVSVLT